VIYPEPQSIHIFVYGTLRAGRAAADLLRDAVAVGSATVRGTLYDIDGAYPALVLAGTDEVHGEIWRCSPQRLFELDNYESLGEGLFRRTAVRVGDIACWTYVAGPALAPRLTPDRRLPQGEWPVRRRA
jgi:gamma-glutamylcyclotransferase (GGCT)/AIG2-like uncharacterized protein YtfP